MSDRKGPVQGDKIGELFFDRLNNEGDVVLSCELMGVEPSTQLTVIQDWMDALRNLYTDIYRAEFHEKKLGDYL